MNSRFLLLLIGVAAFTSCSTAYKSGQTPDDVYYSPAKPGAEYVEVKQERAGRYNNYEQDNSNDRWLRMRVRNPYRWNAFDDYDYNPYYGWSNNWNNPYTYNNNWVGYWNNYWQWNSFYNPYCWNTIVVNPKTDPFAYNKVRNFSLAGYTNTNYNNSNVVRGKTTSQRVPGSGYGNYNNSNNNSNVGSSIRRVFNSNNSSGYDNSGTFGGSNSGSSSRSYNPSSSSSSSGSTTGSSSAGSTGGGGSSGGGNSGRRGG